MLLSHLQAIRNLPVNNMENLNAGFLPDLQIRRSTDDSDDAIYQNLAIPIKKLPAYIQKMKERGDGFQKEFQVSHCYVCL